MNKRFVKKIVKCYKDCLGKDLKSIILFGSRARGEEKVSSDYDLFIVANNLPKDPFKKMMFMRRPLARKFKEKICLIAKTPEEVENSFPPLFLNLGMDGKILYDDIFFVKKLKRIREIIKEAKLKRERVGNEFRWKWLKPPQKEWAIDWQGYHEL